MSTGLRRVNGGKNFHKDDEQAENSARAQLKMMLEYEGRKYIFETMSNGAEALRAMINISHTPRTETLSQKQRKYVEGIYDKFMSILTGEKSIGVKHDFRKTLRY